MNKVLGLNILINIVFVGLLFVFPHLFTVLYIGGAMAGSILAFVLYKNDSGLVFVGILLLIVAVLAIIWPVTMYVITILSVGHTIYNSVILLS